MRFGKWKVGDIVTRDGTDEHKILSKNHCGDMIEVECIVEPSTPWTKIGETENNVAWRYDFVRRPSNVKENE